jgi:hypothetical protein
VQTFAAGQHSGLLSGFDMAKTGSMDENDERLLPLRQVNSDALFSTGGDVSRRALAGAEENPEELVQQPVFRIEFRTLRGHDFEPFA